MFPSHLQLLVCQKQQWQVCIIMLPQRTKKHLMMEHMSHEWKMSSRWWFFTNPSEKYAIVTLDHETPRFEVNIKTCLSCHHLDESWQKTLWILRILGFFSSQFKRIMTSCLAPTGPPIIYGRMTTWVVGIRVSYDVAQTHVPHHPPKYFVYVVCTWMSRWKCW